MGQLFSANASGVLDAIYRRLLNFFYVVLGAGVCGWLVGLGGFLLLRGMRGTENETMLDGTSGGHVSLLHKMGFAVRSDRVAQGFIQSDLENL